MTHELLQTLSRLGVTVTVLEGGRIRLEPASRIPPDLIPRIREAKAAILATLGQPTCDCRRLSGGEPVHRPGCPAVTELRKRPSAAWLQDREPDAIGDAVRSLLKPGEYVDERGRIRKVQ